MSESGINLNQSNVEGKRMRIIVTEQGALIPKQFLEGVQAVEIRAQQGVLLLVPIVESDPILQLGKEPISDVVEDASVHHDRYLYANP
jgi:virulence-associated protein VagC